jgi:hypothetical protein
MQHDIQGKATAIQTAITIAFGLCNLWCELLSLVAQNENMLFSFDDANEGLVHVEAQFKVMQARLEFFISTGSPKLQTFCNLCVCVKFVDQLLLNDKLTSVDDLTLVTPTDGNDSPCRCHRNQKL